ncbi:MAG: redoxin domain-containing protein [Lachnospiraceae bacterium]|nr:redoxin domain-containing protein [Lachnospiraceae bacterium]
MKKRILSMSLALALVLGCGAFAACGAENEMPSDEINIGATSTSDGQHADSVEESKSQEQEPYILTFEAITTEGEELTSDIFAQSRLTMINVWATYCNPCLSEMPDLGAIATEYDKADFQMIGIISDVMADSEQSDIDYAKQLIEETSATTYPHLLLNESLYMNLVGGVSAVPTTFFVNQEGELLGYVTGAQAKVTWNSLIEDLLAEME